MKFTQVTFHRVKNMGNYESEKLELSAVIDEHEDADEVIRTVQVKVAEYLGVQPKVHQIKAVVDDGNVETNAGEVVDAGTGDKVEKPKKKAKAKKTTKKKTTNKKANNVSEETNNSTNDNGSEVVNTPSYTLEDVKKNLAAVWKAKGKGAAIEILEGFGAQKSDELKESDYSSVILMVEKCLK